MSGYECVRCGCPGFHLSFCVTQAERQQPCAEHGCADYRGAFAWTPELVERSIISGAVNALRKGRDPVVVLRMLEAA